MKMSNTTRLILTILVLVAVGSLFFIPAITHAQEADDGFQLQDVVDIATLPLKIQAKVAGFVAGEATDLVLGGFSVVISGLTFFFGIFVMVGAAIINWAFSLGSLTSAPFVQTGWSISRDLVNMLFILILLLIAFATILRYQTYSIKAILPRLIIVALLINFSLLGAGVVIDVGTSLGHYFTTGGDPAINVGVNMMAALGVHKGFIPGTDLERALVPFALQHKDEGWEMFVYSLTNLIFILVVAFLFLVIALILLVRVVYLWILLVLMPFALAAWILPNLRNYWNQWWQKFAHWALLPAVLGFFIYFALLVATGFNEFFTADGMAATKEFEAGAGFFGYTPLVLLQFFSIIIILFMAVTHTKKATTIGVGFIWGAVDSAKGAVKGYAGKKGRQAWQAGAHSAVYDTEGKSRGWTQGLAKSRVGSYALRPVVGAAENHKDSIKKRAKEFGKMNLSARSLLFKSQDAEGKLATVLSFGGKTPTYSENDIKYSEQDLKDGKIPAGKSVGDVKEGMEGKKVGDFNPEKTPGMTEKDFEEQVSALHDIKLSDDILNAAPQFAKEVGKKTADEIGKVLGKMDTKKAGGIISSAFYDVDVQDQLIKHFKTNGSLDKPHLAAMMAKNPKAVMHFLESKDLLIRDKKNNLVPAEEKVFEDLHIKSSVYEYVNSYMGKDVAKRKKGTGSTRPDGTTFAGVEPEEEAGEGPPPTPAGYGEPPSTEGEEDEEEAT